MNNHRTVAHGSTTGVLYPTAGITSLTFNTPVIVFTFACLLTLHPNGPAPSITAPLLLASPQAPLHLPAGQYHLGFNATEEEPGNNVGHWWVVEDPCTCSG